MLADQGLIALTRCTPPYRKGRASRSAVETTWAIPCSNSASSGALPLPGRMSVVFLARSINSSSA